MCFVKIIYGVFDLFLFIYFSGVVETYIPARFLRGLLPDILLSTHEFWQDDLDNIKGCMLFFLSFLIQFLCLFL